jgi:ATP adenylyltransferase
MQQFVVLDNARLEEQREVMEQIRKEGVCPFCPEYFAKFHRQPILQDGVHWLLTYNQWPYENTRVHLLAVSKIHAEKLADVPPEAGQELLVMCQWAEREFDITSGGFGVRFGDPSFNGGSVRHLHAQIMCAQVTDKQNPHYKPVRLKVG